MAAFCLPVVPSRSGSPTNVGEAALMMKDGEVENLRPHEYHVSIEHELRRKVHPLTQFFGRACTDAPSSMAARISLRFPRSAADISLLRGPAWYS